METVIDGVRRMENLIRDLLSYSRAIHATSEPEPMDSGDALRAALTNLEPVIHETTAVINCHRLPIVDVDRVLLTQVFQNLLSNALKYRSAARPQIEISAKLADGQWIFAVSDNGIGIHATYHDTIFSPFKRLHSSRYPGTGVGLAICRQVLDRLGGRIWVESAPGDGATFFFSLPVSEKAAEHASIAAS
jgi:signal transduction histidine kinase